LKTVLSHLNCHISANEKRNIHGFFSLDKKNKMADNEAITLCEGELTLSSPPKPTRIIQIENITTPQRQHFVQNTFSLPEHAGEAAVAKKIQVLRLEKRIEFWGKLQVYFEICRWMCLLKILQ
jgi:hypothetical protein